jgi:osmotically inducible lipoprotein OsmB
MLRPTLVILGLGMLLAACGETTTDRALSGAGIGAAAGGATSAVTGGNILGGAALGGAGGAAAGGLTDEDDVNLGDPVWNSDDNEDDEDSQDDEGLFN